MDSIQIWKEAELDLTKLQQLPDHRYVLQRFHTIRSELPKTKSKKFDAVLLILSQELQKIWIHGNVPPASLKTIKKRVADFVNSYEDLKKTAPPRRLAKWNESYSNLCSKLKHGFDILGDETLLQNAKDLYGTDYREEDKIFYEDNCVPNELNICPRLRWCGSKDRSWEREARKEVHKQTLAEERQKKVLKDQEMLRNLNFSTDESLIEVEEIEGEELLIDSDSDSEFTPSKTSARTPKTTTFKSPEYVTPVTRRNRETESITESNIFPSISVRSGFKDINADVMECLVVMESVYKVDARKSPHLLAYIANKLLGQNWTCEEDRDSDAEISTPDSDKVPEEVSPLLKKRNSFQAFFCYSM